MALPLYACIICNRRYDDPSTPFICTTGYGHRWEKILGDGPKKKDMKIPNCLVCEKPTDYAIDGVLQAYCIQHYPKKSWQKTWPVCDDPVVDSKGQWHRCILPAGHKTDHQHVFVTEAEKHQWDEKVVFKGGAASTKIPGFKYLPMAALVRLARRFELGQERHKEHAWNPLNPKSATMLNDTEWLIERLSHVIHHCYKEIEFLTSGQVTNRDRDDNAAAIMWGGACLIAADERNLQYVENGAKNSTEKSDKG